MIKKLIFNTAKTAFKKAYKKYKGEVRRSKKLGTPVVPYDLVKSDIKRRIRSTKFMDKTAYEKAPKAKSLPKGGPRPKLFGKAYASDKKGKSMQIPMMTKEQRKANQEAISQSVRKFISQKFGRKKVGGVIKAAKGRFI